MKTIAFYLGNEPYPKQGGMERVTDLLVQMLSKYYQVLIICKEKNRLGEVYVPPVPLFYLTGTINQQRETFISLLKRHTVNVLIDQCEGGVMGRYGLFRNREMLDVPAIQCIAVQHNSAMSILKNYYIMKQNPNQGTCLKGIYRWMILPCMKRRAYRLQQLLSADLDRNYDQIVTLSPSFIPHFYTLAPRTKAGKVISISNPNTYELPVESTTGEKTVLFVGRLDNKAKGVDRLLRIWQQVEAQQPDWTLKIVGDGQDKQMLIDLAHKLKLTHFSFEGFQPPKPYYETASIFCMTSTFEGFGMVLTEAMQHGVVPIAFNSYDALQDIVTDEVNGVIVPAFNEKEYAEKLSHLMSSTKRLKQLSEETIQASMKFSRDKIVQKWIQLIDSL